MTDIYPDSAISSWSGYVYQGKVALYHSLKLLAESKYPNGFKLQLDSVDDFAIYADGSVVSAHQVKGKASKYRSSYEIALKKSALVTADKTKNIERFFHVSAELDSTDDFTDSNSITVKFYDYNGKKFCELNEIELITREFFNKIYENKGLTASDLIFEVCYCKLSEQLTRKVIDIHYKNQIQGISINELAFQNVITSEEIEQIITSFTPDDTLEVSLLKFKKSLSETLELYVINNEHLYKDSEYERANNLFAHIYGLSNSDMESFCQLIQPAIDASSLRSDDIENYIDLVCDFLKDPIFLGIPHYSDSNQDFYVPTAIRLTHERQINSFKTKLASEISKKNKLAVLLFEYKNLIADTCQPAQINQSITSPCLNDSYDDVDINYDRKITKQLMVNIISVADAEKKLI